MDTRNIYGSAEMEEFPTYDKGKSSEGKPLSSDSEMQKIEYKAPEGFKYEFANDEKLKRSGYLLVPIDVKAETETEDAGAEKEQKWRWGDSFDPSPHVVNSFFKKGSEMEVILFPVVSIDYPKPSGSNQ